MRVAKGCSAFYLIQKSYDFNSWLFPSSSTSTDTLTTLSPPNFTGPPSFPSSQTPHSEDSHGVPIAFASRDVTVRVKINQSETLPGPKLEVEGFVGSLYPLLLPQQLSMLLEMATGIANKGTRCMKDCIIARLTSSSHTRTNLGFRLGR